MRSTIPMLLLASIMACGAPGGSQPPAAAEAAGSARSQSEMTGMAGMNMSGSGPIRISAQQVSLAGVTFAVAREAPLTRTVRAVAMAVPNERGLRIVNARVNGWVEELHADETGRFVQPAEPLLELYAPELVTTQEELLLAKRLAAATGGADSLLAAARRRLALWDIGEDEVSEIEQSGAAKRRLTIRAPSRGHILEKHVIEGQMIHAGDRLFKIADLSSIWIEPAIFEADIPLVRVGQPAEVTFDALPGHRFQGRLTFVYPELDMQTRTLRVRVEVPNRGFLIKPMMYGVVRIVTDGPHGVIVPLPAVLPTGTRDLAFVVRQGGVVPTEVVVGSRGDSTVLLADGLAPGDTVVASATFLFDSESQLAAAMAGIMLNMGMGLDMGGMPAGQMDMPGMDRSEIRKPRSGRRP